jgi:hypothetical protein
MHQLQSFGLGEATFAIGHFDAGRLELENLSLGNGDGLEIARIEARFSARGLFASRLDALQISGVRLRGTLDEAGLSFGPLDRMFEQNTASTDPNRTDPLRSPQPGSRSSIPNWNSPPQRARYAPVSNCRQSRPLRRNSRPKRDCRSSTRW